MTITKRIHAPVGAGITRFVAELAIKEAAARGGKLTIIASQPEIREQWRRFAPAAEIISYHSWQRLEEVLPTTLIVVGEHRPYFYRSAVGTLDRCPAEVWLVNEPVQAITQ